jgi:hypothetical protein
MKCLGHKASNSVVLCLKCWLILTFKNDKTKKNLPSVNIKVRNNSPINKGLLEFLAINK